MHVHVNQEQVPVKARPGPMPARASRPSGTSAILAMQRQAGNRAVTALLRTAPTVQRCGGVPADQCPCHGNAPAAQTPAAVQRDGDPLDDLGELTSPESGEAAQAGASAASGTSFVMASPQRHRVSGTTPEQIQGGMSGLDSGGHVEVVAEWTGDDRGGRVANPSVTVTMTKHTYVWGRGRDSATEAHRTIIDRYFELINAHEDRHIARNRTAFTDAHAGLAGKTPAQADAHFMALQCRAGRSDEALDTAEGCVRFTTNYQGAELVGLSTCGHPAADYTSHLSCPSA